MDSSKNGYMQFFPDMANRPWNQLVYYEASWTMRTAVIQEWIDGGETNLSRLLARFLRFERQYSITGETRAGQPTGWLRYMPVKKSGSSSALDRLENWHPGMLRGKPVEVIDYLQFDLADMLADLAGDVDCVFELGSGYGLQLFRLFLADGPRQARYIGGEFCASGRELAEKLARLEPNMRFESVAFDLRRPDWSALDGSRKALIFTSWALMYVNDMAEDFFESLARWPGEATLVFCEPVGFQWGVSHPISAEQAECHAAKQLNGDLVAAVNRAAAAGLIEPLVLAQDVFAKSTGPFDLFSLLVCHKPGHGG